MKNVKYIFPNLITLFNLISGCLAIIIVFIGENEYHAAWFIFIAAVFDFFDGFVARALNAKSDFGAQLDSLADIVSFGVAPGIILVKWLILILTNISVGSNFEINSASSWQLLVLFTSMLYVVGGAIRLARFNISPKDKPEFRGLPIPAAALMVASLWLLFATNHSPSVQRLLLNIYVVLALIIVLTMLMVSNIPMLSLKFRGYQFVDNFYQYLILVLGGCFLILFGIKGVFLGLAAYILISLVKVLLDIFQK
jgi:CDP-diacylglycerol--serine O-phosphatidyltransferase